MLNSANQAWTMYPGLTHGAYAALENHGTDEQKPPTCQDDQWRVDRHHVPDRAHCGTDLGLMRTKAEPRPTAPKITGNKIFISAGEHDMADNIIHLVLARLPDAPPASRASACSSCPSSWSTRTAPWASATASTAAAWSTRWASRPAPPARWCWRPVGHHGGQPNKGMQGMFVMMNAARLGVGNQSLGLTEVAYQNALAYAKDRIQMRVTGPKAKDKPADPIIVHPDVRKMLLTAKAYAEGAARWKCSAPCCWKRSTTTPTKGAQGQRRTAGAAHPIAKAFLTDNGHIATNACMQVFGGHGFIKEWGMEQFVRDNRINMIYEGTNTIQSLDLLGRKVLSNNGATLRKFGKLVGKWWRKKA